LIRSGSRTGGVPGGLQVPPARAASSGRRPGGLSRRRRV